MHTIRRWQMVLMMLFGGIVSYAGMTTGRDEVVLAEGGEAVLDIALAKASTPAFRSEVEIFADILSEMSGAKFRIVDEEKLADGASAIFVGDTAFARSLGVDSAALPREHYVVRTCGNGVVIAGAGELGAVYAMHELLDRLGYRCYDAWNELVPKVTRLALGETDVSRAPDFSFRIVFVQTGGAKWGKTPLGERSSRSVKATLGGFPNRVYGRPGDTHTFYDYIKEWPKTHPELLSKTPDGKTRALTGSHGPNFCVSDPLARKLMKAKLREFIAQDRADAKRENRAAPLIYNIAQNDGSSYLCKCPRCEAFVKEHNASGLLLDLINELARDIAVDYPDILIETFAYCFTEPPPRGIKAEKNVIVELCNTSGNYYEAVADDKRSKFPKLLSEWSNFTTKLAIWDYWVFYWDAFPAPYHNLDRIDRDIRHYHNLGAKCMRIESEACETANFFAFKVWYGYKLLDDVHRDARALREDFFNGYYGEAALEMLEYADLLAARQKGQYAPVFVEKSSEAYRNAPRSWLDADFYAKAEEIFARAERKVANDARTLANVHRERIPIDISLLNVYDTVRPSISREALAARYRACAVEHIHARVVKSAIEERIAKVDSEIVGYMKAGEISKNKNKGAPFLVVPRAPEKVTTREWLDNRGFATERKITMSASLLEGNLLQLIFDETGREYAPIENKHSPWFADDFEILLSHERDNNYLQLLVMPSGEMWCIHKGDRIQLPRVKVKSEPSASAWHLELTLPLEELPVKDIRHANFFHSTRETRYAWSPTFFESLCAPEFFGSFQIEEDFMPTLKEVAKADVGRSPNPSAFDYTVFLPRPMNDPTRMDSTTIGDKVNEHVTVVENSKTGSLLAFWTQETQESCPDVHIAFSRSADQGKTWSKPRCLFGSPTLKSRVPTAKWQLPMVSSSGNIYLVWNQAEVPGWVKGQGRVMASVSKDDGATWSEPVDLGFPTRYWCSWQRPMRFAEGGRFLTAVSIATEDSSKTMFMRFENIDDDPDPKDIKIEFLGNDSSKLEGEEASIVKLPDGRLFAVMRSRFGYPLWTQSRDGGNTWSESKPLKDATGKVIAHPRAPCPIYDLHGDVAGSGEIFGLFCDAYDPKLNQWRGRGPLYRYFGKFDSKAEQPVQFTKGEMLLRRDGNSHYGNSCYSSFTFANGIGVLWYPDEKFGIFGVKVGEK